MASHAVLLRVAAGAEGRSGPVQSGPVQSGEGQCAAGHCAEGQSGEGQCGEGRSGEGQCGAVTTEFVLIYGALLALVMSVIHFGLVFNAALAVADAADTVLETAQVAGGSRTSGVDVAKAVIGDERLVRDLAVDVSAGAGEVTVTVSATAPQIVPGLPVSVSHRARGPVERFIPQGRR